MSNFSIAGLQKPRSGLYYEKKNKNFELNE